MLTSSSRDLGVATAPSNQYILARVNQCNQNLEEILNRITTLANSCTHPSPQSAETNMKSPQPQALIDHIETLERNIRELEGQTERLQVAILG